MVTHRVEQELEPDSEDDLEPPRKKKKAGKVKRGRARRGGGHEVGAAAESSAAASQRSTGAADPPLDSFQGYIFDTDENGGNFGGSGVEFIPPPPKKGRKASPL